MFQAIERLGLDTSLQPYHAVLEYCQNPVSFLCKSSLGLTSYNFAYHINGLSFSMLNYDYLLYYYLFCFSLHGRPNSSLQIRKFRKFIWK